MRESYTSYVLGAVTVMGLMGALSFLGYGNFPMTQNDLSSISNNSNINSEDQSNKQSGLTLDWQRQLQESNCTPAVIRHGDRHGEDEHGKEQPIINIEEKVKNDADSGVAGNYWAFDTFSRRIRVWKTGTSTFCALVTYEGSFQAAAGQTAPSGTGTLAGSEKGSFDGGYRSTITGTLLAHPLWPVKGKVGPIDYACDISGNCPGYVDWTSQYFSAGVNQNLDWWGWIYHGGRSGVWINAVSGNQGNIISPVVSPTPSSSPNKDKDKDKDKDN